MSNSKLPARASLEYLKKLAKDRLKALKRADPRTTLATAQLAVAREHGFSSWRALKAEVERRQMDKVALFFDACARGDADTLRELLANDASLVSAENTAAAHHGWTGLHSAAQGGHLEAVRVLLERGADPNAREAGDNTYPLHWAAAGRHLEVVRVLLDAGGDVHGFGDAHELDAIGWASFYHAPGHSRGDNPEMIALLLERGARHHIFSAMSVGELDLIREVVEQNAGALERRMSRFEQGQTPLHFAMNLKRYDILDLLVELGADLEARDLHGHTALTAAMLSGDREAMRRLQAAGALQPKRAAASDFTSSMATLRGAVKKCVPTIHVPDVAEALAWYTSIGFEEIARYGEQGAVNFGMVSFGKGELMLNMHGKRGDHDVSLWFYTDQIDRLYQLLQSRQLDAAQAALAGDSAVQGIEFVEYLYEPFYGGREFGIRDLNGYNLYFMQES
ncbi:MAG: ankyrin repeat domain-containing protein [Longimicrobiales bacterium]